MPQKRWKEVRLCQEVTAQDLTEKAQRPAEDRALAILIEETR